MAAWLEANPEAISAERLAAMPEADRLQWAAREWARIQRDYLADLPADAPERIQAADRLAGFEASIDNGTYVDDPNVQRLLPSKSPPAGTAGPEARAQAFIDADPELKAIVADTEALARAAGVEIPAFEKSTEPSTVAEAIRAAAFCLTTEFDVS